MREGHAQQVPNSSGTAPAKFNAPERVLLAAGQSHAVPTNRPHQVTPHGNRPCRFLLVQGVGKYDRHPVDPKSWKLK
jgi:mannose-6-phosphate isomerase-like protein (cupin superfamily)